MTTGDPRIAVEDLAAATKPWLFGVRHHSPACAVALPPLLEALQPTAVAIELPADLAPWLQWLGHPDAVAPLAIAGVGEDGGDLGFYPFADFSPELVALRWAREHGVPVHAIDLPMGARGGRDRESAHRGIERRLPGSDDDSWEHMVEGPGTLADPERVRRAALLYGWALRMDAHAVSELDRAREAYMRAALARIPQGRVAAVIGAFHAVALVAKNRDTESVPSEVREIAENPRSLRTEKPKASPIVSSLIPYGFELLDARSGYPAGIRDPAWHQRLWATQRDRGDVAALVASCLVEITRHVRDAGLPASVPDARAAAEMTMQLAQLRGLQAPGRRELVEAAGAALAQGEMLGRGRIVARAMEAVLVGRERGRLAEGTPRSGLAPHVGALLAELRLPVGPEPVDLRLDPLRSRIDRRRHVALARLRACGVPYAEEGEASAAGGVESLTTTWRARWTPATEALIELAGLRGVTLRQASAGALRAERARLALADKLVVMSLLALVVAAAEAGAGEIVSEVLVELTGPRLAEATLPELIAMLGVIDRIASGHVVALPADPDDAVPGEIDAFAPPMLDRTTVMSAAVASVLGLAGSEALGDARSLAELVRILDRSEHAHLGDGRLRWSIARLVATGTPVIAGAALVVQVLVGVIAAEELAVAIGAWVDGDDAALLAGRLSGALVVAGPLFEAAPVFLDGLVARVEQLPDAAFLARVAALREGFEVLSNASRRRLLESLRDRLGVLDVTTEIDPAMLALAAAADQAGRAAITGIPRATGEPRDAPPIAAAQAHRPHPAHDISVADRWRLILGQERQKLAPRTARAARALDELYGNGHGEGSRGDSGQEHGFPTVRAWREEIEALFGARVFEEVAGKAAEHGRVGALLELDPESVTPSIELLEQMLSLKGGLGEAHLGKLRALIRHVVDGLVRELAVRVRPALSGAIGARATRRPTGILHLARTVGANLAHVRDGRLIPERLYFKQRTRRHLDWHIVLVVDVSGSMEPSVIYSAMMAAILSAVPWISVKFVAFSTEIVDLSEHASDPLALLLEIAVGGGTHIAKGLRYARSLVTVPRRTIVLVVSDFEEGYAIAGLLGEVRALVEAGVTCLGLAALDDAGAPRYAVPIAEQVAAAGMPVAALTPLELARFIGEKIR